MQRVAYSTNWPSCITQERNSPRAGGPCHEVQANTCNTHDAHLVKVKLPRHVGPRHRHRHWKAVLGLSTAEG